MVLPRAGQHRKVTLAMHSGQGRWESTICLLESSSLRDCHLTSLVVPCGKMGGTLSQANLTSGTIQSDRPSQQETLRAHISDIRTSSGWQSSAQTSRPQDQLCLPHWGPGTGVLNAGLVCNVEVIPNSSQTLGLCKLR